MSAPAVEGRVTSGRGSSAEKAHVEQIAFAPVPILLQNLEQNRWPENIRIECPNRQDFFSPWPRSSRERLANALVSPRDAAR